MNRYVIGAILIAFAVGALYLTGFFGESGTMRNVEMLSGEGANEVATSTVNYFENAEGLLARPTEAGSYPGVVMIHENRGLRPEIRAMAEELAAEGYIVLAVDLLGGVAEDQDGARALTANFSQEKGVENMRAAAAFLRGEGATKIASLGWCFGGRQSLELAMSGEPLAATIVYYGGGMATSTEALAPIEWPVLGIFGDQDQVISADMVGQFETSLNTLGIQNEIYMYPGVGHAFANPSGMNYAPEETKDAWAKTIVFLNSNLR